MKNFLIGMVLFCSLFISVAYAEVSEADKALAKESEDYCTSTATVKPTPEMIIQKVNEACELVAKEGKASFSKFKGKSSNFIFAGTYIWINTIDGKMLMHPIKPAMEGQELLGLKDSNGKLFFVEMINLVKEKGEGWVDYMWPKPGEKERSMKVSFVKKVLCDGAEVVMGCGVYDMSMEEVKKSGK